MTRSWHDPIFNTMNLVFPSNVEPSVAFSAAPDVWPAFDERIISFISAYSEQLLAMPGISLFPEIAALGFWFRKRKLTQLKASRFRLGSERKALGTIFQIAPANVDTLFMYCCLLSLLLGNNSWVRLPSSKSQQVSLLVDVMTKVLDDPQYKIIQDRIRMFKYPHNDAVTNKLSECCDLRVIWGGDNTIETIQTIAPNDLSKDVCFPTRYSMTILDAKAVIKTDIDSLVNSFYNDAFPFGQQACSSPLTIYWVGIETDIESAKYRFWGALEQVLNSRNFAISPADGLDREISLQLSAMESKAPIKILRSASFVRLSVDSVTEEMEQRHAGNGLFFEVSLGALSNLNECFHPRHQTLTYFGLSNQNVATIVNIQNQGRSIKRVVPVGQALHFNEIWDGIDLIDAFSMKQESPLKGVTA